MAARENQGLQIALIIFVTLTVLLSLTTFVFFRNYQNEQQRAKDATTKEGEARQSQTAMSDERNQLMGYIGFQATEKKEAVTDAWTKDMAAFQALRAGTLPDDQKTYRKMTDGLRDIVRAQHGQLEKQANDFRDAKALYERKTTDYETQLKALTEEKDKKVAEYEGERERINQLVKELNESKSQLNDLLQKREKEMEGDKAKLQGTIAEAQKSVTKLQGLLQERDDQVKQLSGKFSVNSQPSGKIVWVNQRDNLVYINLGTDDNLHKRVTFAVFDQNTTDPTAIANKKQGLSALESDNQAVVSEAKRKAVIEVINVTQPHMAECRILTDMPSNPMLPGDIIYTPLWRPGQQTHFALVGFLDLDGNGSSDRQKVHDIIRTHHGVIDKEVDDKGNAQGALTSLTRYLVEGDNNHEGLNPAAGNALVDEAKVLGVEAIDLAKFLDLMGYTPQSTVERDSSGRLVRIPEAGEPDTNFRPRAPMEANR